MIGRVAALSFFVALTVAVGGCSTQRGNPTGPTGDASSGGSISAPRPLEPASGAELVYKGEPLRLTVANGASTGSRPVSYTFEGSPDAAFATDVFQLTGVAPGGDGTTSVTVSAQLAAGRTYYWRARATDGVVTSPYSFVAFFTLVQGFVLEAPDLLSPADGAQVSTTRPTLRVRNADRSGQIEPVTYRFEVSTTADFATLVGGGLVAEQSGETSHTTGDLAPDTTHHWRARAESASATGPWSVVQTFQVVASSGGGGGVTPPAIPPGVRPTAAQGAAVVAAVLADMHARGISADGDCGAFEVVKRVAWVLRDQGAGLEAKPGGRNCQGHSIDIVMFLDGMTIDILIGAGVDNVPTWLEHGPFPELLKDWRAPSNPD